MKFSALALDYDGTIATDGIFDLAVRQAVAEAWPCRVHVGPQETRATAIPYRAPEIRHRGKAPGP